MVEPYKFRDLKLSWYIARRLVDPNPAAPKFSEHFVLTYSILLDDPSYPELIGSQKQIEIPWEEIPQHFRDNFLSACRIALEMAPGGRPVILPGKIIAPTNLFPSDIYFTIHGTSGNAPQEFTMQTRRASVGGPVVGVRKPETAYGPHISSISGTSSGLSEAQARAVMDLCSSADDYFRERALQAVLQEYGGAALQDIESRIPWVFVSYRSVPDDEAFARKIASAIDETLACKAWFFPWEAKLGDPIPAVIEEGMQRSTAGVIVYTPEYFEGDWAKSEHHRLVSDKVKERKIVIGALLRTVSKGQEAQIQVHLYADFRDSAKFDQEFQKVYRALLGKPLEERPR